MENPAVALEEDLAELLAQLVEGGNRTQVGQGTPWA
jgi:hypothetical protein